MAFVRKCEKCGNVDAREQLVVADRSRRQGRVHRAGPARPVHGPSSNWSRSPRPRPRHRRPADVRSTSAPSQTLLTSALSASADPIPLGVRPHDHARDPDAHRRPLDELDDDDRPIGRILTRREVLALIGAGGAAAFLAACAPAWSSASSRGVEPAASASALAPRGAPRPPSSAAVATALPACVVAPGADRGAVLRRCRPRALRHPREHLELRRRPRARRSCSTGSCRRRTARRACRWRASSSTCGTATRSARIRVSSGNSGNFLRGFQRTDANGTSVVHDDLPGLVPGPRGPHPLQDPHRPGRRRPGFEFTSQLFFDDESAAPYTRPACTPRRAPRTSRTNPTRSSTRAAARRCCRSPRRATATGRPSRSRCS